MMKETDIRKYAALMRELGLTGLEITDEAHKVRLERAGIPLHGMENCSVPDAGTVPPEPEDRDCISVKSAIVGVFYAAPAENAAPYVSVGDSIKKGQTLCLIEAMKLMNEITADEDGVIVQICVANGQVVEYGTELFRIKRTGA